jgi:hypothetical protein
MYTLSFVELKKSSRVTRLGEFSPIGRVFTLGSFLKITKVAQSVVLCLCTLFHGNSCVFILTKNRLGNMVYNFSSGHPGRLSRKLKLKFASHLVPRLGFHLFGFCLRGICTTWGQGCQMVGLVFKPKIQIWINFGGPWNEKCWYILWPFGIY